MWRFFQTLSWLTLLILCHCQSKPEASDTPIRPVRYDVVAYGGGQVDRSFSGLVKAGTQTNLSFRVGGIIQQVPVKVGQRVKKGTLVASLDIADAQLQYEQALAAEKNLAVSLQTARATLERVKGLYENNNLSLSEYETAKQAYTAAQSSYESAKKSTRLQQSQLNYGKLYAPMDGVIGVLSVERNENVTPGAPIAMLNSEADMEIQVGIPETFIAQIKVGQAAKIRLPAQPGQVFSGTVSEVSFSIEAQDATYPVTVVLDKTPASIRPGMAAEVAISFSNGESKPHLVIPNPSVAEDVNGHYVFLLKPGQQGLGEVHRQAVTIGPLTREEFVILEGLAEGDLVVTAGLNHMVEGMTVRMLR